MKRRLWAKRRHHRSGSTLVIVAVLLPVLLGMVGLVIDGGIIMAGQRQARNAADSAALAAAQDLLQGRSSTTAEATATTFVQQYNGLTKARVTVHIPPVSGPYAGKSGFGEVVVERPISTTLIHVLGVNREQTVIARSVAGHEPVTARARVVALNPGARPGVGVSGGGSLRVNGAVTINSEGGGVDENGQNVSNGNSGTGASVSNNGTFLATSVRVVGGVNNPANFKPYDPNVSASPLRARAVSEPDPFLHLPPPTTANGASSTTWSAVNVTGNQAVTLYPGVYPSISVTSGTVTFTPGIYIIRGGALKVTEQNVTADGVMFYVTGSDYNVNTGLPDASDQSNPPSSSGSETFGSVTINAGMKFTAYDAPSSPFHGMLFYQRRWNTQAFNVQGNSSTGNLAGTIYAKWAHLKIAGQGTYNAQFVVGSLETTGSGSVTIDDGGALLGRSNQVFLVE